MGTVGLHLSVKLFFSFLGWPAFLGKIHADFRYRLRNSEFVSVAFKVAFSNMFRKISRKIFINKYFLF